MKPLWPLAAILIFLTTACGPPKKAPVTYYGGQAGAGSAGVHVVMKGDTLYSISKRYDIVMRDIVRANSLNAPFVLNVGERIKLPPPREYTARPGDSLYTVSRLFGISATELADLNDMRPPYRVLEGQILRIPVHTQQAEQTRIDPAPASESAPRNVAAAPLATPKPAPLRDPITTRTPARSSGKFAWPVQGRVISTYGPKKNGLHNDGINIEAARGTPVAAAENGVVVYAGDELRGSGNLVLIRHANRWMTAYAHLDQISVKRGATVRRGQKIGTVGSTGSVDRPQLHFETRRGTEAINPKVHLGG